MLGEAATRQAWVQALLDALADPVAVVDQHQVVTATNALLVHLLGSDPVGRPVAALIASEQSDVLRQALQRSTGGGGFVASSTLLQAGGGRVPVRLGVGTVEAPGERMWLVTLAPDRPVSIPARDDIRGDLAAALRTEQVVLHYQPVVRLHDRRPVLVEALARWEHPYRGLLWPSDFLAAADTPELARALGQRVLREACHATVSWQRGLGTAGDLPVAVNLSGRQLRQPGTVAFVREALGVAGCAPERLMLEVPESALLDDPGAALRSLRALKDLGVGITIDDLGTGSSPLSYLRRFPLDLVKIDRALVAGVGRDTEQSAVVASLVSLASAVGVRCVAEGIETADQLAMLQRLGCELGQGYVFTRPMTHAALGAWLERTAHGRSRPRSAPAPDAGAPAGTRALELQEQGASLHTIAARLNAEGYRNADGRRWHHTSVAQLISARRYPDLPL